MMAVVIPTHVAKIQSSVGIASAAAYSGLMARKNAGVAKGPKLKKHKGSPRPL